MTRHEEPRPTDSDSAHGAESSTDDRRIRAEPEGAPPPRAEPPSPLELLTDRRAMFDTGIGPVAFVTVNAIAGLETAAAAAVGLSVLVGVERLVRRKPVTNAVGGVLGTGIAVFIALRSGSAEGYFVPRMLYAAALSLVFAGSVAIRRPLVGVLVGALWRAPSDWIRHPLVRRAFSEVTFAWSALFAFRAVVYAVLIAAGKAGWLAAASIAMGWPAFLLLLYASYRYLPRRMEQLGAPERPAH